MENHIFFFIYGYNHHLRSLSHVTFWWLIAGFVLLQMW